jgi:hypothetical protein
MHRSGDLTRVWVPDEAHEAMRDLARARVDASMQLMRGRQQLLASARPLWRGPYSSETSITLMIARQLLKEIEKRHALHSME